MASDELPARPLVPATAGAAAGAAGTAAALLEVGWLSYVEDGSAWPGAWPFALAALAGAALLAGGLALRRRAGTRSQPALWLSWGGAGVLIAVLSCGIWLARWDARAAAIEGRSAAACTFVTTGDASISDYGSYSTAEVYDDGGAYLATVRLGTDEPLDQGAEVVCSGAFEELGESDWARSRFMKGEVAVVDASSVLSEEVAEDLGPIQRLRRAALAAIAPGEGDDRALLAGIVCGCTTWLNETDASDDFSRAGISHLVAVSGSHLAYISLLLEGALRALKLKPGARSAVLGCVMAAYVAFSGGTASAVRSVCMVVAGMLTGLGQRRSHPLSALALTVAALVILDPGVVYDMGFQLSAMSVLFIDVFGRYATHLLERAGLPEALSEPLSLTLCAQWATAPITVPVFGELSLVAPLANLVCGPLMSALLVVGLVCVPAAMLLPAVAELILAPACWLSNASIFCAGVFASFPWASLIVDAEVWELLPLYALAVPVYLLWRDWSRGQLLGAAGACAAACLAYVARWTLFAPAGITVLDVGQADSILVRDGASTVLVDAGVDDEVVTALARNHVYQIDAVVITHWDEDHWGGLPDVLESVPVDLLVVAEGAADDMPEELAEVLDCEVVELGYGDALGVGGFSCTMVWPQGEVGGSENEDSIALLVEYDEGGKGLTALLTGDTESDELEQYAGEVGDIDFLKVGHHGSKASVSAEALAVLEPELAVASAGEGNYYGHPTDECIEACEEAGALFLCTIEAGDVCVAPAEGGMRVCAEDVGALG